MKLHPAVKALNDEIDAFLAETGMSATAFGTECLGDSNFLPDIRGGGRLPSLKTMDRVRAFMSRHERSDA